MAKIDMNKITKTQDWEGDDWYWIPNKLLKQFNADSDKMSSIGEYMDDPDAFDEFEQKYGKYKTGGSPDLVPDFYEGNKDFELKAKKKKPAKVKPEKEVKLTEKQENFCQAVAIGDTYADAYRKAYSTKNQKVGTIYTSSSKLMDDPKIFQRVAQLRAKILQKNEMTVEELLEQMAEWMRFDPLQIIDPENDCVKFMHEMDKQTRMSISEVKIMEMFESVQVPGEKRKTKAKVGEIKTIKFYDKTKVADMFMKKFGQYITTVNVKSDEISEIKDMISEITNTDK